MCQRLFHTQVSKANHTQNIYFAGVEKHASVQVKHTSLLPSQETTNNVCISNYHCGPKSLRQRLLRIVVPVLQQYMLRIKANDLYKATTMTITVNATCQTCFQNRSGLQQLKSNNRNCAYQQYETAKDELRIVKYMTGIWLPTDLFALSQPHPCLHLPGAYTTSYRYLRRRFSSKQNITYNDKAVNKASG